MACVPAGRGQHQVVAWRWHAASTISAPLRAGRQVRQLAVTVTGKPRAEVRGRPDTPVAEAAGSAVIEVTFTPAEPQLNPAAARAVLAMLLRARDRADHAEKRRT